ncbi:unnamed protein product [Prunus armeniaca]
MQAKLMKMAKKGSASGSQQARGLPYMSVAQSQATGATTIAGAVGGAAWVRHKRRAEEPLVRDVGKRRVEEEPRRDVCKRPIIASVPEVGKRASVDPVTGPLEPWVDAELVLSSYQEAIKRMLKVEVV